MTSICSLFMLVFATGLTLGCSDTPSGEAIPDGGGARVSEVSFRQALRVGQILGDDLPRDSLHAPGNSFWTDSMVCFRALDDTSFEVTNFAPFGLARITVLARLDGVGPALKVLVLDSLGPHVRLTLRYPPVASFATDDGRTADVGTSFRFAASGVRLDYLADSPRLQQIKSITAHWNIRFHDYAKDQPDHKSWNPIRPAQARLMTALMMNTAYLFSRLEYKERFLKERFYKDVNDSSREVADSSWFSPSETAALYDKLMVRTFQMGIVIGGGLGGGTVLGIDNGTLTNQFGHRWHDSLLSMTYLPEAHYAGPHPLLSHEIGHCLGYGHNSNVCSTGRLGPSGTPGWSKMFGFPAVSTLLHSRYVAYGLLPCSKADYYRPEDFRFAQPAWGSAF